MQRVLLDGTTLMSAARLLTGADPPSGLNVWSLSLLVESLILHEEILVLDTEVSDDGRLAAAATVARVSGPVRIERRNVDELIDQYTGDQFGLLRRSAREVDADSRKRLLGPSDQNLIDRADRHLRGLLEERRYTGDASLEGYLANLDLFHEQQRRQLREQQAKRRSRGWEVSMFPTAPGADGTALGALGGDMLELMMRERFVDRYSNGSTSSAWRAGSYYRHEANYKFTRSIVIRTHLYLVASQVVEAPYRADIFRAPICIRFFDEEARRASIEERYVAAAEAAERQRVRQINDFLGRPAFVTLPLFLARAFAESRTPADVVATALSIRESRAARRFREQFAGLYDAEAEGDVGAVAAELGRYAQMLNKEYGSPGAVSDNAWSFAASAANAALSASASNLVGLGAATGKGTDALTGTNRRWAYRRKMALISQSIRKAKHTGSLQPHLKRIFGAELPQSELEFLRKVDEMDTGPSR